MSRHRFDPSALVGGALFLTIGIRYLVEATGGHRVSYGWAVPSVIGAVVLIYVLRLVFRARSRNS